MRPTPRLLAAFGAVALSTAALAGAGSIEIELVTSGLARPVQVVSAPGDTSRIFIVEQRTGSTGRVRVYDLDAGNLLSTPFLTRSVSTSSEQGLLGMTFHPDYASNGYVYINYTSGGQTFIERRTVSATNPNVTDAGSAFPIISYSQPFSNHNGGWLDFGPDGFLYISNGDGGSGNDPGNRAQDLTNQRMGKMLRLDVDGDDFPADANRNYAIPASNPFVGSGPDDEIWAYGLRNAWRCAFDRQTGDLWMADVGQNAVEEINFQPASSTGGENYGWRCMEGNSCTGLSGCTCNSPSLVDPIQTYSHSFGCSITGGHIYRGSAIPWLDGTYFYADYCTNRFWSLRYDGSSVQDFTERTSEFTGISSVSGFGEDANGEMYVCSLGGAIFKIVPGELPCPADLTGNGDVGFGDLTTLLSVWGDCGKGSCDADMDGDGTVGFADLLIILTSWGPCP